MLNTASISAYAGAALVGSLTYCGKGHAHSGFLTHVACRLLQAMSTIQRWISNFSMALVKNETSQVPSCCLRP